MVVHAKSSTEGSTVGEKLVIKRGQPSVRVETVYSMDGTSREVVVPVAPNTVADDMREDATNWMNANRPDFDSHVRESLANHLANLAVRQHWVGPEVRWSPETDDDATFADFEGVAKLSASALRGSPDHPVLLVEVMTSIAHACGWKVG